MQKEPTKKAAGKRNAGANPPRKLSRAEKKQIAEVIRQAKGDGKAHTAQQTIPYLTMYPDGICKVSEKKYSKSIAFEDINYQLAQADDKTAIFENWCDFLNYFDASVSVQLSFINQGTQREQAEKAINIPAQDDAFNSIRTEYSDMLKNQLGKLLEDLDMPHIRFHDLRHTAATNMHQLTGDFYTVGEVLGHTLAGIGVSLGLSMNFEAVTARYVDVRLERKKEVLDAYHGAVKQADPAKAEKAEPKKAKSAAKKKSSDLEL